jgi:hypothetical protein
MKIRAPAKGLTMRRILTVLAISVFVLSTEATAAESKFPVRRWMELESSKKLAVMREYIKVARNDNVILRLPAEYYVKEIDAVIANAVRRNDLQGLDSPLGVMIHTVAAMEGDWDNGEDKLEHVRKWMGPKEFENFKRMYPEKYQRLANEQDAK